jgi:hypothetical protein
MSFTIDYNSNITFDAHSNLSLSIEPISKYNPIIKKYFTLSEEIANKSILNYEIIIKELKSKLSYNIYEGISNSNDVKKVFIKFSPLEDPIKILTGKKTINELKLPKFTSSENNQHNMTAYVDSFFSYLTSKILHHHNFINALDCYGSYSLNKREFRYDIQEDIEYLLDCKDFLKNKEQYQLSDVIYDQFDTIQSSKYKKKLVIENENINIKVEELNVDTLIPDCELDLSNCISDLVYKNDKPTKKSTHSKHSSSCSSRSSITNQESIEEDDSYTSYSDDCASYISGTTCDEPIYATLKNFPTNMILLENCKDTLDDYSMNNEVSLLEWNAIFMQIIMSLVLFQEKFYFIHNDLHDSNIMYVETDKEYLYYKYNNIHYKVPTYGKIWKIIDFGRAIYKFNGQIFFSDSFSEKGDASTQYNCEPYLNPKKNIVPPNFSFDLCRLATSLYDFFFEDEIDDKDELNPIQQIILEWVTDDKGRNILYKNNGDERYPDFKLYKMITRSVHNHIPKNQLTKAIFSKYSISKKNIKKKTIMNIDEIPCYV